MMTAVAWVFEKHRPLKQEKIYPGKDIIIKQDKQSFQLCGSSISTHCRTAELCIHCKWTRPRLHKNALWTLHKPHALNMIISGHSRKQFPS